MLLKVSLTIRTTRVYQSSNIHKFLSGHKHGCGGELETGARQELGSRYNCELVMFKVCKLSSSHEALRCLASVAVRRPEMFNVFEMLLTI